MANEPVPKPRRSRRNAIVDVQTSAKSCAALNSGDRSLRMFIASATANLRTFDLAPLPSSCPARRTVQLVWKLQPARFFS